MLRVTAEISNCVAAARTTSGRQTDTTRRRRSTLGGEIRPSDSVGTECSMTQKAATWQASAISVKTIVAPSLPVSTSYRRTGLIISVSNEPRSRSPLVASSATCTPPVNSVKIRNGGIIVNRMTAGPAARPIFSCSMFKTLIISAGRPAARSLPPSVSR